jgi:hypothetical protein
MFVWVLGEVWFSSRSEIAFLLRKRNRDSSPNPYPNLH